MTVHGPNREAERIRIILETLKHTQPTMTLDEAVPLVFNLEKETAKLEALSTPPATPRSFGQEDLAHWIDGQSDIQDLLRAGGKKIQAIKEVRLRTSAPLKEAKEGVEEWEKRNGLGWWAHSSS